MAAANHLPFRDELMTQALARGQTVRLRATSQSMVPTVRPGDLLLVCAEGPEAGDIAVYRSGEHWVTHRVMTKEPGRLVVCGDAPGMAAQSIDADRVVGRVVAIRRDWLSRCCRWRRAFARLVRR